MALTAEHAPAQHALFQAAAIDFRWPANDHDGNDPYEQWSQDDDWQTSDWHSTEWQPSGTPPQKYSKKYQDALKKFDDDYDSQEADRHARNVQALDPPREDSDSDATEQKAVGSKAQKAREGELKKATELLAKASAYRLIAL